MANKLHSWIWNFNRKCSESLVCFWIKKVLFLSSIKDTTVYLDSLSLSYDKSPIRVERWDGTFRILVRNILQQNIFWTMYFFLSALYSSKIDFGQCNFSWQQYIPVKYTLGNVLFSPSNIFCKSNLPAHVLSVGFSWNCNMESKMKWAAKSFKSENKLPNLLKWK